MKTLPEVTELLPHRGRFLLLDRLLRLDGEAAHAQGHFEPEDVEGHFPDGPIVPGVLLLEGLAQTMMCLSQHLDGQTSGTPLLAGFEKARFRAPVRPPVTVTYQVSFIERRFGLTRAAGTVLVDGVRVCTAMLSGIVVEPTT